MYEESERRSRYTESRRSNAKIKHMSKHMVEHMPKHMETETETINENKIELEYPNNEYKRIWKGWIEYKKIEHKQKFKSEKTEQTAINNLVEISNGDWQLAEKIVNNSISNRYKGLFPISENKSNFNKPTKIEMYANTYNRVAAALRSEENGKNIGF